MKRAHAPVVMLISIAALAASPGCRDENAADSLTNPIVNVAAVDPGLVGSWYRVGSQEGIGLEADGVWSYLYVFQNRLAPGYYDRDPAGHFETPQEGMLVHTWSDGSGQPQSNAFSYSLENGGSTLVLHAAGTEPAEELRYVRIALGGSVLQR